MAAIAFALVSGAGAEVAGGQDVAPTCAAPTPGVDFVGRVQGIEGTVVVFDVERVDALPDGVVLAAGSTARVDHGDDASLLREGESYRVHTAGAADGWVSRAAPLGQSVVEGSTGDVCDSRLTTLADGTRIETSWIVRHHVAWWGVAGLAAMVLLIIVVESTRSLRRHRIESHLA